MKVTFVFLFLLHGSVNSAQEMNYILINWLCHSSLGWTNNKLHFSCLISPCPPLISNNHMIIQIIAIWALSTFYQFIKKMHLDRETNNWLAHILFRTPIYACNGGTPFFRYLYKTIQSHVGHWGVRYIVLLRWGLRQPSTHLITVTWR